MATVIVTVATMFIMLSS